MPIVRKENFKIIHFFDQTKSTKHFLKGKLMLF
jgi:hypothetical protein